jgi:hypothetical protein
MLPQLNLFTASALRSRALRSQAWLFALLLCACEHGGEAPSEPVDTTPDEAAVTRVDAASAEAGTTVNPAAFEAGQGDGGAPDEAGADGGVAPDAGAMDAAVDAGDASSPQLDAQLSDAAAAIADAGDASSLQDASDAGDALVALPSIYDDDRKWLCRPGLPNSPCLQTLEVTDVLPDGGTSVFELPKTPADVAADCLYLYPTIDPGLFAAPRNLDFPQIDRAAVEGVFFTQAVPFRAACALYAPIYRQTSLTSFEQTDTREKGLETAYRDLEAAFDYYLRHAAPGRPIVLLAHSQGAIVMSRLLQRRFEGHPELMARLVVAVLAGPMGGVVVPRGGVLGGTLKQIPLCTTAEQTGCVLSYNSFAASAPPNADYTNVNGLVPAGFDAPCTSPPGGPAGTAARLKGALFSSLSGGLAGLVSPTFDYGVRVRTRYARLANFYTARCADSIENVSYLRITAEPLPGDVRRDPVPYNHLTLNDRAIGLHALDYTFVAEDLFEAVQTKLKAHGK